MASLVPAQRWRVAASSVRGVSHIKSNLPCQDAAEWEVPSPTLLLAAVADGAGSASESFRGASLACRAALEVLRGRISAAHPSLSAESEAGFRAAFASAREAVLAEAEKMKLPPRELASTLILAAATPDAAMAMQIGDGAALVLKQNDELEALTQPPEAEYLNETLFLITEDAEQSAQVRFHSGGIKGLALFSDGLQMLALKMPGGRPHQPFFTPLFRFVSEEPQEAVRHAQFQKFLMSPRITERADDDLTLVVAVLAGT